MTPSYYAGLALKELEMLEPALPIIESATRSSAQTSTTVQASFDAVKAGLTTFAVSDLPSAQAGVIGEIQAALPALQAAITAAPIPFPYNIAAMGVVSLVPVALNMVQMATHSHATAPAAKAA